MRYTPLHAAAESGQIGALLLMIEAGAFVDEQVGWVGLALGVAVGVAEVGMGQARHLVSSIWNVCHVCKAVRGRWGWRRGWGRWGRLWRGRRGRGRERVVVLQCCSTEPQGHGKGRLLESLGPS